MNARFTVVAGALIRGAVRRALRSKAWNSGVGYHVEEEKGFIESVFYVEAYGPDDKVIPYVEWAMSLR